MLHWFPRLLLRFLLGVVLDVGIQWDQSSYIIVIIIIILLHYYYCNTP